MKETPVKNLPTGATKALCCLISCRFLYKDSFLTTGFYAVYQKIIIFSSLRMDIQDLANK